ncbi:MAG: Maf-like protein [Marinilabiliales bacterium]|nr:Maf-like protein [Marinilabiliales bacterium]
MSGTAKVSGKANVLTHPLFEHLAPFQVLLGSQSPRRKELLRGLNIPFTVETKDVPEIYPEELACEAVPEYLARLKSKPFLDQMVNNQLIITADTVVLLDGQILGKPLDAEYARQMLKSLSGKMHQVITGVCLTSSHKQVTFSDCSSVWFKPLHDEEIDYYLSAFQPFDKAGSYGVQEWIGYVAIERIEGSYFNVMGLPVQKVYEELMQF